MDVVNEENSGAASAPIAAPERSRSRPAGGPGRAFGPARRVAFLGLVGGLLAGAVAMQAVLGTYAASGGGVAAVRVPRSQVALSLLACLAVAVALGWGELRARAVRWLALLRRRSGVGARAAPFPTPDRHGGRWYKAPPVRVGNAAVRNALAGMAARGWVCVGLVGVALGASLVADLGARAFAGRATAQWWWVASVLVLLLAAGVLAWPGAGWRAMTASARRWRGRVVGMVLVGCLLLGALALRLPGLTNQPYVVHGDEAACGLEALRWLSGGVPSLISVGWYGLPVAGYGWPALVMRVAGADLYGLRLSSVIIGVLAVALLYALAREFVGRRVAFVAAALFAVAHVSIQFSRMGIHYIHAPFVVLLTLWMLARALRTKSALAAVLAGVGLSLSLQVYFSARIVLVIVPLFVLGLALLNWRALKGRLLVLGWVALSFVVAFGPMEVYFLHDPASLQGRPGEVLILNMTPGMRDHLISQFGTANLATVLLRQLAAVPLYLGGLPDQSLQYGPHAPLFDALLAALATIGFLYALLHLRRPLHLLLVVWVVCTVVVGGVLTIDQPWWPRLLVMVPALCLLGALALEKLLVVAERAWRGLEWALIPAASGRRARAVALGGALALVAIGVSAEQSARWYFVDYPRLIASEGWRAQYTEIGRYLETLPAGTEVLLLSDDGVLFEYSTLQFLAPQVQGQRVGRASDLPALLAGRGGPVVVLITPGKRDEFQKLLATPGALPAGEYAAQPGLDGAAAFFTYRVGGGP